MIWLRETPRLFSALLSLLFINIIFDEAMAAKPLSRSVALVVVLRRPNIRHYEDVAEAFKNRVRANVKVVPVWANRSEEDTRALAQWFSSVNPTLVFTIGQTAFDFGQRALTPTVARPIVYTLAVAASHDPAVHAPVLHDLSAQVSSVKVMETFRHVVPHAKRIAVVYGTQTESFIAALNHAPNRDLEIVPLYSSSPERALTQLRMLPNTVDGIWLVPDLHVITPQVFHYALGVQFRRRIPLIGGTKSHVERGALLALDHAPTQLGYHAASIVNQYITDGEIPHSETSTIPPRLTLNKSTARRLNIQFAETLLQTASEVIP